MPIYEYYCEPCHTVFSFLVKSPSNTQRPSCPRCGRTELPKRPSRFATLTQRGAGEGDPVLEGVDEQRLEGAMQALMKEMGGMEEATDPRAMGHLMRRFSELSGLDIGERLEETLGRIDAGEDLEAIEAEMESMEGDDDLEGFFDLRKKLLRKAKAGPEIDDTLYFL